MRKVLGLMALGLVFAANAAYANGYVGVMKGTIKGAEVIYKDADEITVRAGYGECDGHYWELQNDLDVDIYNALPSGEDFVYIYIDDSASSYPTPTIIGDTVEPTWSNAKMGWYNGDDRCIGAVWSTDAGRSIWEFQNNDGETYLAAGDNLFVDWLKYVLVDGNPDGTFQRLEASDYTPVNAKAIKVRASNRSTGQLYVVVTPYECQNDSYLWLRDYHATSSTVASETTDWIEFQRNFTRDLAWMGEDDDDNKFRVIINGYQIER